MFWLGGDFLAKVHTSIALETDLFEWQKGFLGVPLSQFVSTKLIEEKELMEGKKPGAEPIVNLMKDLMAVNEVRHKERFRNTWKQFLRVPEISEQTIQGLIDKLVDSGDFVVDSRGRLERIK